MSRFDSQQDYVPTGYNAFARSKGYANHELADAYSDRRSGTLGTLSGYNAPDGVVNVPVNATSGNTKARVMPVNDWDQMGPNKQYSSASPISQHGSFSYHHHRPNPPPEPLFTFTDREPQFSRHSPASPPSSSTSLSTNPVIAQRSTLWWGELEPWMDEEYAKQVCSLMGWDTVNVKVPHPAPDPATGQQPNNPGYCFLTFPSPSHAASVLQQIESGPNGASSIMPNSTKPFVLNWASSIPASSTPVSSAFPASVPNNPQMYPKEYSIFVGDLAPETSNSDLVAVFRNPVLGLRNDREPKFIRPFLSCKSAKIMLDPVTGVSRGYGFVRFTDEADQQRALIEMHGLYCLSRPMRISPATAKYKPQTSQYPTPPPLDQGAQAMTVCLPLPTPQSKSVSGPIAATTSASSLNSTSTGSPSSVSGSSSMNTLSTGTSASSFTSTASSLANASSEDMLSLPNNVLLRIAQQYASGEANPPKVTPPSSVTSPAHDGTQPRQAHDARLSSPSANPGEALRYMISEESWKHHAQARAILGNLIGPNGEQLTSTDPYNTTVFVGGLSPLISEETLRTFFAPFGDIHYVKVPVGKHCGFVQFVRKADAEKAIEKMQGFPIGGSRIRLSWGRSQYKAAQAAAQAAQAAALQASQGQPFSPHALSPEQAIMLLQKFAQQNYQLPPSSSTDSRGFSPSSSENYEENIRVGPDELQPQYEGYPAFDAHPQQAVTEATILEPRRERSQPALQTSFSPFSPDPNGYNPDLGRKHQDIEHTLGFRPSTEGLPHPSNAYAPGFYPRKEALRVGINDKEVGSSGSAPKLSPTTSRPPPSKYNSFLGSSPPVLQSNRAPARPEASISRPPSGSISREGSAPPLDAYGIHDLNGTLASLDLDRPWKSPSSESSGNSVQFRMTMGGTPSP